VTITSAPSHLIIPEMVIDAVREHALEQGDEMESVGRLVVVDDRVLESGG
jgi:hypothetical protein